MAKSALYVGQTKFRSVEGIDRLVKRFAAIPDAVAAEAFQGVDKGADLLVEDIRRIAPVSELEDQAGTLRDSVRKEKGDGPLEVKVVEDGRAARGKDQGKAIAKHVEHGHKDAAGGHVYPVPHFWPAYRVNKKRIRARVARGVTKAVKASGNVQ